MKSRRLRAPATDGALLAEPPLDSAGALLVENSRRLDHWNHDFQGRLYTSLRPLVRLQALEQARAYHRQAGLDLPETASPIARLVSTGHQPELFHPGVWVKNFAVARIAREQEAVGLNLIVDNDIPKSSSIRVPNREGDELRTSLVEFDDWAGEVPYEDWRVRDENQFASFSQRVRETLGGVVADPLIDDFWPRALRRKEQTSRYGQRFASARREVEAEWGARNWEVPLSAVCETEGFHWFASHLLAQLPRFHRVHNEALAQYRAEYGIRSKHHPVPNLTRRDDWWEAPFWVWLADAPRRRPLLVQFLSRTMLLRVDGEDQPLEELPLAPDREACCAVDRMQSLRARGIRLRTRALTTTMFARLFLSDLFVHGIGGAKYDELGDEIVRRFFGLEPPGYLTMSMTLWLNLGTDQATPARLHETERALRDLTYNPDRRMPTAASATVPLIAAKRAAIAGPVKTHPQRLERFQEIRRCNEGLQPWVEGERRQLTEDRSRLLEGLRRNALARHREYALVLHSQQRLREAMTALCAPGDNAPEQKNERTGGLSCGEGPSDHLE